jgi:hypothetical protein
MVMTAKSKEGGRRAVLAVVLGLILGLGLLAPKQVLSTDAYPIVSPYAELSAAWWQWVSLEPPATNPGNDTSGIYAGLHQTGDTWFLAGAFGGVPQPVTRTVTIPSNKELFFPVVNVGWFMGPIGNPLGDIYTEEEMRSGLFDAINGFIGKVSCTVDGVDVPLYRTQSPAFTLTLYSDDNIFGGPANDAPAGYFYPTVSDGFWALLDPLSVGSHTIHFTATDGWTQDVTYNINVVPLPGTMLLLGTGLLGLIGFGLRRSV